MKTPRTLNFELATLNYAVLFVCVFTFNTAFAQTNQPVLSPVDALWKEARTALETKQYAKAQPLFNDFLKRFQTDSRAAEARICAGICDYRQGQVPRALDVWNRTVNMELMQKRASPALLLGLAQLSAHYRDERKLPELNKILGQLQSLFPNDPVTAREHLLAANARFEAGDFAAAVGLYEKAGQLRGRDADNYKTAQELAAGGQGVSSIISAADRHLAGNSPVVAGRLYEEVLKRNPVAREKHDAMIKLGWCLYLQKEYDKAEKLWRSVITSAPRGDEMRGESRWRLVVLHAGPYSDTRKARALCEEQFAEFKGSFLGRQAKLTMAWLHMVDKQWQEAQRHFQELVETYSEQDNPRIAEYIRRCEEGMRTKAGG